MTPSLIHFGLTAALFGLIWTIQLVHYPAFRFIAADQWKPFHQMHTRKITLIVFPLMLGELGIACWQLWHHPPFLTVLICCIPIIQWILTAALFMPLHGKLGESNDPSLVQRLVRLNWLRTSLWSLELLLLAISGVAP